MRFTLVHIIILLLLLLASPAYAQFRRAPASMPAGVRVLRDVEYVRAPGEVPLKLDLYLPKADRALPLVIFVHGGGWRQGDKRTVPVLELLAHGYAVASINYRLSDVAIFPAQIHDCKAAVRFLRAHADDFGLDAKHFGAWGSSAGGHLVALLGTSGDVAELEGDLGNAEASSRVQAVIDLFGPSDFATLLQFGGNGRSAATALLGGAPSDKPELARLASPVTHVTPDDPPFLISHGNRDMLVPVQQGELMHATLKQKGVESELFVANAGHGWAAAPPMEKAIAFLDRHLKKKQ